LSPTLQVRAQGARRPKTALESQDAYTRRALHGENPVATDWGTDGSGREAQVDARDLGPLLEEFRPRLRRMVALRLDPRLRSRIDCSDVLQEAFVDATRRLREYHSEKMSFFLWVRLLTDQKVKELQRRHLGAQKRDVRREQVARPDPDASTICLVRAIVDQRESPSQQVSRKEQEERLRAVLEKMKPIDREILLLRHFERLSMPECAQVLELSLSGAKQRHGKAAVRLRRALGEHGAGLPPGVGDGAEL